MNRKIRIVALVAGAAAALAMLGAGPAAAAHRAAPAAEPLLAMVEANEDLESPSNPLCDTTQMPIGVDPSGELVLAPYEEQHEQYCDIYQAPPIPLASGWGNVIQIFADPVTRTTPATSTIFSINTDGELTAYGLTYTSTGPTLSSGTVIGYGWDGFTHVTYAGDGVFYAVAGDGTLLWYRDLDVAGRTANWADGGTGAAIGSGWQDFPLVFASGGAVYASTGDGSLLWYGYSDPTSATGTWADNSGAVIGSGWDTVRTATANAGQAAGHVLIHTVGEDGNVHFYDHLAAGTGDPNWSPVSGVVVRSGWAG